MQEEYIDMINSKIFKAYDIRGIYPKDINEKNIKDIIRAIYTYFITQSGKALISVVLSHDMRLSSPKLYKTTKSTLLECGATIIDIGLSSTPTCYGSALRGKYDAGIQISASHNPKEYNGLKFFRVIGSHIDKISKDNGMERVRDIAIKKEFIKNKVRGKIIMKTNALQEGISLSLQNCEHKYIKNFKIVADTANSMGSLYLIELFKHIPGKLIKMNFTLDGNFPSHQPDPLQTKFLRDIQDRVIKEKADLGIAPDGDGDRVFFINEKGGIIPPTLISSLIAKEILTKTNGKKIIVDVRYTKNVQNTNLKYGGTTILSKIGHALITSLLNKENAEFAGESSGHYYYRDRGGSESAVQTILYLLNVMGRENKPISIILADLQTSIESGEINFILDKSINPKEIIKMIEHDYRKGQISFLDGISVDFSDWRFNIRTSNTEPLLRLNVEGETKKIVKEKLEEVTNKLIVRGAKIKD